MAECKQRKRASLEDSLDSSTLEVIRESQLRADKLCSVIMWCLCALAALMFFSGFYVEDDAMAFYTAIRCIVCIGFLLISQLISLAVYRRIGDRNHWYRHFIVVVLIVFALYGATAISSFAVNLVLPVLLSSRYFDKKFTLRVGIASLICLPIATFCLVGAGMHDQYYTVLAVPPESGYIPFGGVGLYEYFQPYDLWGTFFNVFIYDTSTVSGALILTAIICYVFADQSLRNLIKQAEDVRRQTRVDEEMKLAARIRDSVLSDNFDVAPDSIDLFAQTITPHKMGDTFYDIAAPDAASVGFAIGDPESDSPISVLRMMESISMFRGIATTALNIKGAARILNDSLRANNKEHYELSMFIGLLNLETGMLSYVDAAFPGFFLVRNGKIIEPERLTSPAIGAENVHKFYQNSLMLQPNDVLVLYTQGLPENQDTAGKHIAKDSLSRCFEQSAAEHGKAEDICRNALASAVAGTLNGTWDKDFTIMVMRFLKPNPLKRNISRETAIEFEVFAVFVVATDVEFNILRKRYAWTLMGVTESGFLAYHAQFNRDGKMLELVMVRQNEEGMVAAADFTTNLIWRFHPQYIICVGVAAGLNAEALGENYADVVVGSSVFDYSSGRYTDADHADITYGTVGFTPREKSLALPAWLVGLLREAAASPDCQRKVHIGPIACGAAVVANYEICEKQVLKQHPDAVGLDMESFGIAHACSLAPEPKPYGITIKGISDFADSEKNYDHQAEAAASSCEFALLCVERYLPNQQQE